MRMKGQLGEEESIVERNEWEASKGMKMRTALPDEQVKEV